MIKTIKEPIKQLAVLGLVFCLPGVALSASAKELTAVSYGGSYQMSQRKAYFEPFARATNTKVTEDEWTGEISKISAMVQSNQVTWDVVDVDSYSMQQGCDDGVLEKIDYSKLQGKQIFEGGIAFECGVPSVILATVVAYNANKLKDGPTTINDFFDLKKYPGKRGMWRRPVANLEFALIADGVPVDQVYKMLGTKEGLDRAFAKLDTIKNDIVWWEAGGQPPQLLASGEVVMSTAWNGRIYSANKDEGANLKIVWDGQVQDWDIWAIPKGAPNLETAYEFIKFASQPENQAEQTKYTSYAPAVAAAKDKVDPAALENLPTAPQNSKRVLKTDAQFWADNNDAVRKRFDTWLSN
ncbi:polyamine ABC transporter substrate-binding protein [Mesorhizobium caraganae]|uniref:polyamine ABC transporter substrate-binding protein n=1 Tax=Mesorhizobium caraganae TaxID=483206 RepID=UPI0019393CC4|nr:ABC transporter substrate-binding protein [Mesorhizobium caraganae]MBM2715025.1 polyamine ABC transporter substrate-binding protein [Mesorhizobium caraganae]